MADNEEEEGCKKPRYLPNNIYCKSFGFVARVLPKENFLDPSNPNAEQDIYRQFFPQEAHKMDIEGTPLIVEHENASRENPERDGYAPSLGAVVVKMPSAPGESIDVFVKIPKEDNLLTKYHEQRGELKSGAIKLIESGYFKDVSLNHVPYFTDFDPNSKQVTLNKARVELSLTKKGKRTNSNILSHFWIDETENENKNSFTQKKQYMHGRPCAEPLKSQIIFPGRDITPIYVPASEDKFNAALIMASTKKPTEETEDVASVDKKQLKRSAANEDDVADDDVEKMDTVELRRLAREGLKTKKALKEVEKKTTDKLKAELMTTFEESYEIAKKGCQYLPEKKAKQYFKNTEEEFKKAKMQIDEDLADNNPFASRYLPTYQASMFPQMVFNEAFGQLVEQNEAMKKQLESFQKQAQTNETKQQQQQQINTTAAFTSVPASSAVQSMSLMRERMEKERKEADEARQKALESLQ